MIGNLRSVIWTVQTQRGRIVVREQLEPDDEPGLLRLFAESSDFFEAATGAPSGSADVQSLFYSLPDGASFDDKRQFTVRDGERIIGVIDAVLRYPDVTSCAIGMFLISASHRREGIGTGVAQVLLNELRELGFTTVAASATEGWEPGTAFLRSLGFTFDDAHAGDHGNRRVWRGEAPVRRATLSLKS